MFERWHTSIVLLLLYFQIKIYGNCLHHFPFAHFHRFTLIYFKYVQFPSVPPAQIYV